MWTIITTAILSHCYCVVFCCCQSDAWPFDFFCDALMNDLFNSSWETRHGAAIGLREVINTHGTEAGRSNDRVMMTSNASSRAAYQDGQNLSWLADAALRLVSVLALDRFGDFVSDEVVAPVRETCAQALGTVLKHLPQHHVMLVLKVLRQLFAQPQWEARHGGFLGVKYMLSVRKVCLVAIMN